jgi:hypothetical protein
MSWHISTEMLQQLHFRIYRNLYERLPSYSGSGPRNSAKVCRYRIVCIDVSEPYQLVLQLPRREHES